MSRWRRTRSNTPKPQCAVRSCRLRVVLPTAPSSPSRRFPAVRSSGKGVYSFTWRRTSHANLSLKCCQRRRRAMPEVNQVTWEDLHREWNDNKSTRFLREDFWQWLTQETQHSRWFQVCQRALHSMDDFTLPALWNTAAPTLKDLT